MDPCTTDMNKTPFLSRWVAMNEKPFLLSFIIFFSLHQAQVLKPTPLDMIKQPFLSKWFIFPPHQAHTHDSPSHLRFRRDFITILIKISPCKPINPKINGTHNQELTIFPIPCLDLRETVWDRSRAWRFPFARPLCSRERFPLAPLRGCIRLLPMGRLLGSGKGGWEEEEKNNLTMMRVRVWRREELISSEG